MSDTITKTIKTLERSIAAALPDMDVFINISIKSKPEWVTENVKAAPEEETTSLDLEGVRTMLNSYVKVVGPKKAIALVQKFTPNKTKNVVDIPAEKYMDLIKAIEGVELEPGSEAA